MAFSDRGFPFLLGPVRTMRKNRVWRLQKNVKVLQSPIFVVVVVFATLFTSEINEIFRITRNVWKLTEFTFSSSGAL